MNKSSITLLVLALTTLTVARLAAQVADTSVEPFGFHRGMAQKAIIDLVEDSAEGDQ